MQQSWADESHGASRVSAWTFATRRRIRSVMDRFLPTPEQCVLLASFDGGFREQIFNAAFGLLYGTGMLTPELLRICPRDITSGARMRIAIGGFRARVTPVPAGAASRLTQLLDQPGLIPNDAPIFRAPPVSIGKEVIITVLKRRSTLLGFPQPVFPSDLRIAFVRHMAERGTPIEEIAAIMGLKKLRALDEKLTSFGS